MVVTRNRITLNNFFRITNDVVQGFVQNGCFIFTDLGGNLLNISVPYKRKKVNMRTYKIQEKPECIRKTNSKPLHRRQAFLLFDVACEGHRGIFWSACSSFISSSSSSNNSDESNHWVSLRPLIANLHAVE